MARQFSPTGRRLPGQVRWLCEEPACSIFRLDASGGDGALYSRFCTRAAVKLFGIEERKPELLAAWPADGFIQARSASLGTWPTFGPKLSSHTLGETSFYVLK